MRRNCAPVAISDIHRDELINFLSTFKFLMGEDDCTLSLIMALVIVQKIHRNYLFMTFLSDRRSYRLQIRGKKDTTYRYFH